MEAELTDGMNTWLDSCFLKEINFAMYINIGPESKVLSHTAKFCWFKVQ